MLFVEQISEDCVLKLINDDCLKAMASIEDCSIDLVVCDLPYNITNISWDKIIPFDKLWESYRRVLKPTGTVLLFGVGIFTTKVILSNPDWYKQTLIWNKNKCGSPGLAKVRPMQVTEDIVVFSKGKTCYNPIMQVGEPYSRKSSNPEGYVAKQNTHGYGLKPVKEISNTGTRYPKNLINISVDYSAQQRVHPTQKPVKLMQWLIETYSNEGDTVLDNCMGSGPVGVASVLSNRNFIGIEIDEEYFKIASERIYKAMSSIDNDIA